MNLTRCFARSGEVHRIFLEIGGGVSRRHPAVEVGARGLVARIRQLVHESLQLVVLGGPRRVQSRGGEEHRPLEVHALPPGERDFDAVVRGALGNERLRREKWIHRELHPPTVAHEMLLEERVVDVMSRVAFVAREVDRAVDVNRQIGIHLDQASIVALIPVVAAPRLVGDVFDGEAFVRRKRHVLQGSLTARRDRGLKYRVELLARNHERPPPGVVARGQRALSREPLVQRIEDLLKVRRGVCRGDCVVERFGLLVEGQALAFDDADARVERGELTVEILMSEAAQLVSACHQLREFCTHVASLRRDRVEVSLARVGVALPLCGAVVGVDVVLVVLTECEDRFDVPLGEPIHRRRACLSLMRLQIPPSGG